MKKRTRLSKEVEKELGIEEPKEPPKPNPSIKEKPKIKEEIIKPEIKLKTKSLKFPKITKTNLILISIICVLLILVFAFSWDNLKQRFAGEEVVAEEKTTEEIEEEVITEENETVEEVEEEIITEENETVEVVTEENVTEQNVTINETTVENETIEEVEEEINLTPGKPLKVYFVNVLGDGIVILTPNEKVLVIDGGDEETDAQLVYFMRRGLELWDIHAIVATHPDEEHIAALKSVIFNFNLRPDMTTVYDTNLSINTGIFKTYKALAEQKTTIVTVKDNTEIDIDNDLKITVLSPYVEGYNKDLDDNCLVTKLVYKNVSFLFTSDCGLICKKNILQNNDVKAKILQIPNHGIINEAYAYFLEKVDPEVAVVTNVGKDLTEEALETLAGINIYQTSVNIVLVETDGIEYNITQQLSI